jgi:hypothetical protein
VFFLVGDGKENIQVEWVTCAKKMKKPDSLMVLCLENLDIYRIYVQEYKGDLQEILSW